MVNKLKRKFIIINMSIVAVLIIIIFSAIVMFSYRFEKNQTERYLESTITLFVGKPHDAPNAPSDPEGKPSSDDIVSLPNIYAFCVRTTKTGEVVEISDGLEMTEASLEKAVLSSIGSNKSSGILRAHGLMFLRKTTVDGYIIAFTASEPIFASFNNTLLICIILSVFTLGVLFFVSERLANYVVEPVDKAWKMQKQFIADSSHDLKTPLTVIMANDDILKAHPEATVESQMKWIDSTHEEAVRMRGLVEKMLDLAKSEDISSIELSLTDVSELTEMAVLNFEPVAFEKEILIDSSIHSKRCVVANGDAYLRIIHILLDNAIKYSPKGSKISVKLFEERQKLHLAINNKGEPIKASELEHVFERFYRADKARSTDGYGLGLSIAKNLADALNADIWADSSRESGTTFHLTFKRK